MCEHEDQFVFSFEGFIWSYSEKDVKNGQHVMRNIILQEKLSYELFVKNHNF